MTYSRTARAVVFCTLLAAFGLASCSPRQQSTTASSEQIAPAATKAASEPATQPTLLQALLKLPGVPKDWRIHLGLMTEAELPDQIAITSLLDRPPSPNTPDEIVLNYWMDKTRPFRGGGGGIFSPRVEMDPLPPVAMDAASRRQLLDAAVRHPSDLSYVLDLLDENDTTTHDRLKHLLDTSPPPKPPPPDRPDEAETWQRDVHDWLMENSRYFRDELKSRAASMHVEKDGVGNQLKNDDALNALAKLDWDAARPLAERQMAAPGADVQVVAFAAFVLFEGETKAGHPAAAKAARTKLLAIAADPNAPAAAHSIAVRSLIAVRWVGEETAQDKWVVETLSDPDLVEPKDSTFTYRPVAWAMRKDVDRWSRVLISLVSGEDQGKRDAAAQMLLEIAPDPAPAALLRPLLPWLADPKWSSAPNREMLLDKLEKTAVPEAVPGLIAVLCDADEKLVAKAAKALVRNPSPAAAAALRAAFARGMKDTGEPIVAALLACAAISDAEAAAAIEAHARYVAAHPETKSPGGGYSGGGGLFGNLRPPAPLSEEARLGDRIARLGVSESLAARLAERAAEIHPREPAVAAELFDALDQSFTPPADRYLLRRATAADADEVAIAALANRARGVRKRIPEDLRRAAGTSDFPGGVAAAVLDDAAICRRFLDGRDLQAIKGLLATARLCRTLLPAEVVGRFLDNKDAELAAAARGYLMTEDGPAARALILARYPGAVTGEEEGGPDSLPPEVKPLQAEIAASKDQTQETFALLELSGFRHAIIRVRQDGSATLSLVSHPGRIRYRDLSRDELAELRRFIDQQRFDDLPPLPYTGAVDGVWYNYVHLTSAGGRRVAMNNPETCAPGTPYDLLVRLFNKLEEAGEYKVRYASADQLPGLRVLLTPPPDSRVHAVWRQGDDLRVLFQADYHGPSYWWEGEIGWRSVVNGKVTGPVDSPPGRPGPFDWHGISDHPSIFDDPGDRSLLQIADGWTVTMASGDYGAKRLWKLKPGQKPVLFSDDDGTYGPPIVTPDGKWIIAERDNGVVRIAADTGQRFAVQLPPAEEYTVVAYVAPHEKVLLSRRLPKAPDATWETPWVYEYFLLDPASGKAEKVTGDFGPLEAHWSLSRPQPTGRPNEYWAAVPSETSTDDEGKVPFTRIGRYDAKAFKFTPVLTVPGLTFENGAIWVDEARGEVLIALEEDVLVAPLPPG
jgi:hypothetical protein